MKTCLSIDIPSELDFIPDSEFHRIFDRVSRTVSLKGCMSANGINKRIKKRAKKLLDDPARGGKKKVLKRHEPCKEVYAE